MKYLEKILMKSYKRTIMIYNVFAFAIMFIILCAISEAIHLEGIKAFIVFVIIITIYIFMYILFKKYLISRFKFENSKMFKILEKRGYKDEFYKTIDAELNLKESIKYYVPAYKVGIIMTPTWFVFISSIKPEIRKTSEIKKIRQKLLTEWNEYGKYSLVFEYKDNTNFSTVEVIYDIDEILNMIKEKYPEIIE